MPAATFGFLLDFFFSFRGRIVSELGLVLSVPFAPSFEPAGANETCGIEATVSVSTVMCCTDPSVSLALLIVLVEALDCRDVSAGGTLVEACLVLSPLTLPLSLPLSLVEGGAVFSCRLRAESSSRSYSDPAWEMPLSSIFSMMLSDSCGDARGLASCTVSRVFVVLLLPLAARAGVFSPGCKWPSSSSSSLWLESTG